MRNVGNVNFNFKKDFGRRFLTPRVPISASLWRQALYQGPSGISTDSMTRDSPSDDVQTIPIAQVAQRMQKSQEQRRGGVHEKASVHLSGAVSACTYDRKNPLCARPRESDLVEGQCVESVAGQVFTNWASYRSSLLVYTVSA